MKNHSDAKTYLITGAAKSSLAALTKTWALEFAPYQITVNTVAPGPVHTESFAENYPKNSPEEKAFLAALPLKRAGLLEEKASFITGQTLFVDGGGSIGAVT